MLARRGGKPSLLAAASLVVHWFLVCATAMNPDLQETTPAAGSLPDPNDPNAPKTMTSKDQCVFEVQSKSMGMVTYDFDRLKRPNGDGQGDYEKSIQVGPNIQFIYKMNICANTMEMCQNEEAPATEALKIPAGETCRILGRLTDPSDPVAANHATYKLVPAIQSDTNRNPWGQDLEITYNNGDMCDPAKQTMRSVSVHLVCDLGLRDDETLFKDVKKEATCNTQYILESRYACPSGGRSRMSKFLIIGIVGLCLYCIGGIALMRFHYKKDWGMDVIPNKAFWAEVPTLAKEGCAFSWEKVKTVRQEGFAAAFSGSGGEASGPQYTPSPKAEYGSGTASA